MANQSYKSQTVHILNSDVELKLRHLSRVYAENLTKKIEERIKEWVIGNKICFVTDNARDITRIYCDLHKYDCIGWIGLR